MKILFFSHNLWNISATARLAVELANVLKNEYNVEVEFAVSKRSNDEIKNIPFKIHTLRRKGELGRALDIKELVEKNNYDIVFSYMLTQNIIISLVKYLLKNKTKTAFIGSVHAVDNYMSVKSIFKYPYRLLMKKLYENLDGIVVVSSAVKDDIVKAFFVSPNKIQVIYNYINIKKIKNLASEDLNIKEKEIFKNPVIINVSRLENGKGHEYLIKAFSLIKEEIPSAKLVILGDGSLRKKLENLAKDLNCYDDIYMPGFVENPFKYLAHSKVFAFPSLWEGTPMVVLEAQALGLPVVAFNSLGGHIDVLKNSGILVNNKDYKALANGLIELLKNKSKWEKYSQLSLENIKNYSVEKKAEEYYNYFLQKIKEKNSK